MHTSVIVASSDGGEQLVPSAVHGASAVIAADGGLDLARSLELRVDLVVGDLDSASPEALEWAGFAGVEVRRSPADKDQTDLELAFAAVDTLPGSPPTQRTLVLGGAGGRLDHLLANVAVMAGRPEPVEGWLGAALVVPVRSTWEIDLDAGTTVSLVPWCGDAEVSVRGVRWPLDRATLDAGAARGVSNVALGGTMTVLVTRGCALLIVPDARGLDGAGVGR